MTTWGKGVKGELQTMMAAPESGRRRKWPMAPAWPGLVSRMMHASSGRTRALAAEEAAAGFIYCNSCRRWTESAKWYECLECPADKPWRECSECQARADRSLMHDHDPDHLFAVYRPSTEAKKDV